MVTPEAMKIPCFSFMSKIWNTKSSGYTLKKCTASEKPSLLQLSFFGRADFTLSASQN